MFLQLTVKPIHTKKVRAQKSRHYITYCPTTPAFSRDILTVLDTEFKY